MLRYAHDLEQKWLRMMMMMKMMKMKKRTTAKMRKRTTANDDDDENDDVDFFFCGEIRDEGCLSRVLSMAPVVSVRVVAVPACSPGAVCGQGPGCWPILGDVRIHGLLTPNHATLRLAPALGLIQAVVVIVKFAA